MKNIFSDIAYLPFVFNSILATIFCIFGWQLLTIELTINTILFNIYFLLIAMIILYNSVPLFQAQNILEKLKSAFSPIFIIFILYYKLAITRTDDLQIAGIFLFFMISIISFEVARQLFNFKLSKAASGISAILMSIVVSILVIYTLELSIPIENLVFDTTSEVSNIHLVK